MRIETLERNVRQQGVEATKKKLAALSLPKLRAHYAREVGDGNRSPNRKFLARRVAEAVKERLEAEPVVEAPAGGGLRVVQAAKVDEMTAAQRADAYVEGRLKPRHMDVESLRLAFEQVVGRSTDSNNHAYLVWKIREAKRGNVTTGRVRRTQGAAKADSVLPLRVQKDKVDPLTAAATACGFGSRNRFIKAAIAHYVADKAPNGLPVELACWHTEDAAARPVRPPKAA